MGAFYTNAICSFEDKEIIEKYISNKKRNAYLLFKENDPKYFIITEEKSDSQSIMESNSFYRPLSALTKGPLLGCIVHDSDNLLLCLFSKGKDAYELADAPDFTGPELYVRNVEALIAAYGADEKKVSETHMTKNAKKHALAEDFQGEIYSAIGVPLWGIGVGYHDLKEDEALIRYLEAQGVTVKHS